MNTQELSGNTYPLSVTRLKEMQEDYNDIASAFAGLQDKDNQTSKYIVAGCTQRGEAGYVVWNGEVMHVEADADSSKVNLDVYTETVSVTVSGVSTHVRTKRELHYTSSSTSTSVAFVTLQRVSVHLLRNDIAEENVTHLLWDSNLKAKIVNGYLYLTVSCSTTTTQPIATNDQTANAFRLPSYFRPAHDVLVPCRYTPYGSYQRAGCMVLDSDGYLRLPFVVSRGDGFEMDAKILL